MSVSACSSDADERLATFSVTLKPPVAASLADRRRGEVRRRLVLRRRVGRCNRRRHERVARLRVAGRVRRRRAHRCVAGRRDRGTVVRRAGDLGRDHRRRDVSGRLVRLLVVAVVDDGQAAVGGVVADREEVGERPVAGRDGEIAAEPVEADRVVVERMRGCAHLAERPRRIECVQRLVDVDVPRALELARVGIAVGRRAVEGDGDAARCTARRDPREHRRAHRVAIDLHRRRRARVDGRLAVRRRRDVGDRLVARRDLRCGHDTQPGVVVGRVRPDDVDVPGGVVVGDREARGPARHGRAARRPCSRSTSRRDRARRRGSPARPSSTACRRRRRTGCSASAPGTPDPAQRST